MRSLMRTRKQLVRERTSHTQRIQKTLEEANIKLDSVISDVLGQSGRAMLEAMIAGESGPERLAKLANPRIKASHETLVRALDGRLTRCTACSCACISIRSMPSTGRLRPSTGTWRRISTPFARPSSRS